MSSKNHNDLELLRALHRYLDGELSEQERGAVEEEIRRRPEMAGELEQMRRTRERVRQAVKQKAVPDRLRESVRTLTGAVPGRRRSFRSVPALGWAAIAACALVAFGFVIWKTILDDGAYSEGELVAEAVEDDAAGLTVDQVLAIRVTYHIRCAVTYYKGETPHYTSAQMRTSLGPEFAGLLDVVRVGLESGEVVVAHRCSFEGRRYVHMILHRGDEMLSYILTKKRAGEEYRSEHQPIETVETHALYSGSVQGYTVAGFETAEYLVYLASELRPELNIAVISGLLPGTVAHLKGVSA